jgi:hypothetical protein
VLSLLFSVKRQKKIPTDSSPCTRLLAACLCSLLSAPLIAQITPTLPPGPVKITVIGETPKTGVIGKDWTGPLTAEVEGGIRDQGVPPGQITWKWLTSVIKDDPTSEDDDETGIGEKSSAIEPKFTPATGSHKTELNLKFKEAGTYFVKVVVEFSNKSANTIGVSIPRIIKIKVTSNPTTPTPP